MFPVLFDYLVGSVFGFLVGRNARNNAQTARNTAEIAELEQKIRLSSAISATRQLPSPQARRRDRLAVALSRAKGDCAGFAPTHIRTSRRREFDETSR
jgi:hypothetical protein